MPFNSLLKIVFDKVEGKFFIFTLAAIIFLALLGPNIGHEFVPLIYILVVGALTISAGLDIMASISKRHAEDKLKDDVKPLPPALQPEQASEPLDHPEDDEKHSEKNYRELEHERKMREWDLREIELKREREVALKEAQKDEDEFALRQPGLRRMVSGQIHAALREQNFQARMKGIETLNTTGEENKDSAAKLALLEKLTAPVNAPPIPQQVRSKLAVDPNQPEPPPVADPIDPNQSPGS